MGCFHVSMRTQYINDKTKGLDNIVRTDMPFLLAVKPDVKPTHFWPPRNDMTWSVQNLFQRITQLLCLIGRCQNYHQYIPQS